MNDDEDTHKPGKYWLTFNIDIVYIGLVCIGVFVY